VVARHFGTLAVVDRTCPRLSGLLRIGTAAVLLIDIHDVPRPAIFGATSGQQRCSPAG
jgi:hypothetical protein